MAACLDRLDLETINMEIRRLESVWSRKDYTSNPPAYFTLPVCLSAFSHLSFYPSLSGLSVGLSALSVRTASRSVPHSPLFHYLNFNLRHRVTLPLSSSPPLSLSACPFLSRLYPSLPLPLPLFLSLSSAVSYAFLLFLLSYIPNTEKKDVTLVFLSNHIRLRATRRESEETGLSDTFFPPQ